MQIARKTGIDASPEDDSGAFHPDFTAENAIGSVDAISVDPSVLVRSVLFGSIGIL